MNKMNNTMPRQKEEFDIALRFSRSLSRSLLKDEAETQLHKLEEVLNSCAKGLNVCRLEEVTKKINSELEKSGVNVVNKVPESEGIVASATSIDNAGFNLKLNELRVNSENGFPYDFVNAVSSLCDLCHLYFKAK